MAGTSGSPRPVTPSKGRPGAPPPLPAAPSRARGHPSYFGNREQPCACPRGPLPRPDHHTEVPLFHYRTGPQGAPMPSRCPLQQRAGPGASISFSRLAGKTSSRPRADWLVFNPGPLATGQSAPSLAVSPHPIGPAPGAGRGPAVRPFCRRGKAEPSYSFGGLAMGKGLGGDLTSGSPPLDAYPRPHGLPWLPRLFLGWGSGLRSEGAPPLGGVWEDNFAGGQNARGVHGAGWGRLLPARPQPSAFSSQEEDLWTFPAEIRTRLSPSIPGRIAKNNNKCLREREGRPGRG